MATASLLQGLTEDQEQLETTTSLRLLHGPKRQPPLRGLKDQGLLDEPPLGKTRQIEVANIDQIRCSREN